MARVPLKEEIKPVRPHLTTGKTGVAGEVDDVRKDLVRCMDRIEAEFPLNEDLTQAIQDLRDEFGSSVPSTAVREDVWINGDTGDDGNDGLTELTAVQTPERAAEIINGTKGTPTKWVVVNLRGTITLTEAFPFRFDCMRAPTGSALGLGVDSTIIVFDGGTDVTVVLDNGSGGDIVSDINSVDAEGCAHVGLSTATWTPKQYRGFWCKFSTGPLAGTRWLVRDNTDTELILLNVGPAAAMTDPGAGAEFHLERPATELTAAPFSFAEFGAYVSGDGAVVLQNVYMTSGAMFGHKCDGIGSFICSHVIHQGGFATIWPAVVTQSNYIMLFFGDHLDTSTETPSWVVSERIGYSQVDNTIGPIGFGPGGNYNVIKYSVIPELLFFDAARGRCYASSIELTQITMSRSQASGGNAFAAGTWEDGDVPGVPTRFGGYRFPWMPTTPVFPDLIMTDQSAVSLNKPVMGGGTWAVELVGSCTLVMDQVSGDDHVDGGVNCQHHSSVADIGAAPSTVSGAGGTVELSADGASQISSWADLAALPISTPECCAGTYWPFGNQPPWP